MKMRKLLCLLLSLVLVLSLAACDKKEEKNKSAKAVAEAFMDAMINADSKAMFDLVPEEVMDYLMESEDMSKSDLKEMYAELDEEMAESFEEMEEYYGGKMKISYDVVDEYDLDEDDLADIQEMYEELDIKVKAAKVIELETTMKVGGEVIEEDYMELVVIKVGSNWYIEIEQIPGF